MLNKEVPYLDIIMKASKDVACTHALPILPSGYSFQMYKPGDEIAWAELEASVEEFASFEDALTYFNRVFMPYQETLKDRMCFIVDDTGHIVSTASAWTKDKDDTRHAVLHWVSTSPDHQGKGLANAIVKYALSRFLEVEPAAEYIYLHTQTWSYKAIALYYKLGFKISKDALDGCFTNMECIPILEKLLPQDITNDLYE